MENLGDGHWVGTRWTIRQSGCVDCPGTTAESCRDDGYYTSRRTFEDCIEICAEGKNPNNVQMHPSRYILSIKISKVLTHPKIMVPMNTPYIFCSK